MLSNMQRLRIKYCRGEEVKFISHLDMMRLWQRAFARAGIPLAYSEGFSPHPQMSLAVPLAVGVTSDAELMDIQCTKNVPSHIFTASVNQQLPEGVEIIETMAIGLEQPSLPAQVKFAEYRVHVATPKTGAEIRQALEALLALKQLPWQHQRDTGPHRYDLRALIDDLWLIEQADGKYTLGMRLRCDSTGSGRPEQVAAALGLPQPSAMHRTGLILK
jgi:radical SAM-linked protein